jgi:hypothetical protein
MWQEWLRNVQETRYGSIADLTQLVAVSTELNQLLALSSEV